MPDIERFINIESSSSSSSSLTPFLDLSLQISPPNSTIESSNGIGDDHHNQLCTHLPHHYYTDKFNQISNNGVWRLDHPHQLPPSSDHGHCFFRPIKGFPIHPNPSIFSWKSGSKQMPTSSSTLSSCSSSSSSSSISYSKIPGFTSPPTPYLRYQLDPGRSTAVARGRCTRAPRIRWTSSLHAQFVNAVELLGGHERATPKSVLELMDVKDLTLAHVKSHLQMFRAHKTTDKPAASPGRSEGSSCSLSCSLEDDKFSASIGNTTVDGRLRLCSTQGDMGYASYNTPLSSMNSPSVRDNRPRRSYPDVDGGGQPSSLKLPPKSSPQNEVVDSVEMRGYFEEFEMDCHSPNLEMALGRSDWHVLNDI